ncbi:hypothetical protein [Micromonospora sp. Llam0]|uniref:hypothetical protein n=1 Tax=Micromonospora sp. Llam0 TaxID=2485143 RepID=UPI001F38CDEE|nr:hypothetical protein [Micromonospora sp. Llam0]
MRGVPEEIPDAESEQVLAWVCAIDVAKESGMACTRIPGPSGRRVSRVWQVAATTKAVSDLATDLVAVGVEKVTVESVGLLADLVLPAGGRRVGRVVGQRP